MPNKPPRWPQRDQVYDLYLAPKEDGHYKNYFQLLTCVNPELPAKFAIFPNGRAGFARVADIVNRCGRKPRFVHILLGERDLLRAIVLRLRGYRVAGIFLPDSAQKRRKYQNNTREGFVAVRTTDRLYCGVARKTNWHDGEFV